MADTQFTSEEQSASTTQYYTKIIDEVGTDKTAPRSPYQNVRTNGRAFNSSNWRMKDDSPQTSPSSQTSTSRTAFSRPGPHAPQAISEGRRLYVGNMPYTARLEDVEALFTSAGFSIERIDIAIDPFTGRNPSYCFVDLQTKEEAERAMAELDSRDMRGRPLKIKPGVAKTVERNPDHFAMDRWRHQDRPSFAKLHSDSSKRVYVGGLPRLTDHDTIESSLKAFFQGYHFEKVSKLFAPHPAKRFEPGDHYYCFVDLASEHEAQQAMDRLNGQHGPWGGRLRVRRANNRSEERKRENDPLGPMET